MRLSRCSVLAFFAITGCYSLHPVSGLTPATGDELAFDLNDFGRVALGSAIGPEIAQVQGRLTATENSEYVVAVNSLRTLRGAEQVWKGEQIRIKPEYFSTLYERQFSPARTYLLAACTATAIAFIARRSLFGGGTEDPAVVPPGGTALRIP